MIAPEDIIFDAWRRAWQPPDRRAIFEWAADNVDLQGQYKTTGRFAIGDSRYLIKPFELLARDEVRMLNILKAIQTGGSLVGDLFFQYILANAPAPFQATFQTDDDAEQHYLTRVEKTLKATPVNAKLLSQMKKKRDLYMWPHMEVYFSGANINSIQRKSLKYLVNDEVWDWEAGFLQEVFGRTEAYIDVCKILNISQAGDQGDEWDTVWNNGHRFEWGCRCEKCGRLQPLSFFAQMEDEPDTRAGVVWDKSKYSDGRFNIARAAETTRFKCCKAGCGHEHKDEFRTWEQFNASCEYLDLDPDRSMKNCSVHWNALVRGRWASLTTMFLQSLEVRDQGSTVSLEKFYKKYLALSWDASVADRKAEIHLSDYTEEKPLDPAYVYAQKPGEFIRPLTADYQQGSGNDTRHLITGSRTWTETGDSRLIWEGRCNTFEQLYQVATALKIPPARVGIDGGFDMMEVAAQCAKYGFTMLIGDDAEYFLHKRKNGPPIRRPYSELFKVDPCKGTRNQGRNYCWAMRWSNPSIKNMLWNLRRGLTRLKWELPGDLSPSWRDGIDSEEKRRKVKKGTENATYEWVKFKKNNHPWDCECMQVVIALAAGCLSFDVEEKPADTPKEKPAPKKTETPTPPHDQARQLELLPT